MKIIYRNTRLVFETQKEKHFNWVQGKNNENKYINILAGLKQGVEYTIRLSSPKHIIVNAYDDMELRRNSELGALFSTTENKVVKFTPSKDIDVLYLYIFTDEEQSDKITLSISGKDFYEYEEIKSSYEVNISSNDLYTLNKTFDANSIYEINVGNGLINIYNTTDESVLYSVVYTGNSTTVIQPTTTLSFLSFRNWSSEVLDTIYISEMKRKS